VWNGVRNDDDALFDKVPSTTTSNVFYVFNCIVGVVGVVGVVVGVVVVHRGPHVVAVVVVE
jgi:hypothetical protein